MKSFINHSNKPNIKLVSTDATNLEFIFANKNIENGEEILIDYCRGIEGAEKRIELLRKHGIVEQPTE